MLHSLGLFDVDTTEKKAVRSQRHHKCWEKTKKYESQGEKSAKYMYFQATVAT